MDHFLLVKSFFCQLIRNPQLYFTSFSSDTNVLLQRRILKKIAHIQQAVKVHEISLVRQSIENRKHHLDMVREQISNMCAKEVAAKNISIYYYVDPEYGATFIFEDDGCGMNYTGDLKNPGRLDRFINLGFSEIVGFKGDEFSWKGLGSKLAFNRRHLEIETWTRDGEVIMS